MPSRASPDGRGPRRCSRWRTIHNRNTVRQAIIAASSAPDFRARAGRGDRLDSARRGRSGTSTASAIDHGTRHRRRSSPVRYPSASASPTRASLHAGCHRTGRRPAGPGALGGPPRCPAAAPAVDCRRGGRLSVQGSTAADQRPRDDVADLRRGLRVAAAARTGRDAGWRHGGRLDAVHLPVDLRLADPDLPDGVQHGRRRRLGRRGGDGVRGTRRRARCPRPQDAHHRVRRGCLHLLLREHGAGGRRDRARQPPVRRPRLARQLPVGGPQLLRVGCRGRGGRCRVRQRGGVDRPAGRRAGGALLLGLQALSRTLRGRADAGDSSWRLFTRPR